MVKQILCPNRGGLLESREAPSTLFPALLGKGWHEKSHIKLSVNSRLIFVGMTLISQLLRLNVVVFSCFSRGDLKRFVL